MISLFCWILEMLIGGLTIMVINIYLYTACGNTAHLNDTDPFALIIILIMYATISIIYGAVIFNDILSVIKKQISDFYELDMIDENKKSHEKEFVAYKNEMKEVLVKTYKEFEERIMKNITDSKIIATIVEKSGYARVLQSYDDKIQGFISNINTCDRLKAQKISSMLAIESNIFAYGYFIPQKYRVKLIQNHKSQITEK